MASETGAPLEDRLAHLERQVKIFRLVAIGAVAVGVVLAVAQALELTDRVAQSSQVFFGEAFVVAYGAGEALLPSAPPTARLGYEPDGVPRTAGLRVTRGGSKALIQVGDSLALVQVNDSSRTFVMGFDGPHAGFMLQNDSTAAAISLTLDGGRPALHLLNDATGSRITLGFDAGGVPYLDAVHADSTRFRLPQ